MTNRSNRPVYCYFNPRRTTPGSFRIFDYARAKRLSPVELDHLAGLRRPLLMSISRHRRSHAHVRRNG